MYAVPIHCGNVVGLSHSDAVNRGTTDCHQGIKTSALTLAKYDAW